MKNENKYSSLKYLALISQFGISVAFPLLLCLLLANFIINKFQLADWVFLIFLILGLFGSFYNAYKFFKFMYYQTKNKANNNKE